MSDPIQQRLTNATEQLLTARAHLVAEITGYPAPMSGCDAQFNHLLAQRHRIDAALDALSREVHIPTPRRPG